MVQYFNDEAHLAGDDGLMDVDVIGFSRGAAEARDFANRIIANTQNGWYICKNAKGQQAVPQQFTSMAEARKALAPRESFKRPGGDCCVIQGYIAKAPIPVREEYAGPLTSKTPPFDSYPGGAKQWELLLDRSLNWRDYLTEGARMELK